MEKQKFLNYTVANILEFILILTLSNMQFWFVKMAPNTSNITISNDLY